MTTRLIAVLAASCLLCGATPALATKPATTTLAKRSAGYARRTMSCVGGLCTRGASFTRSRWRTFQHNRQVKRGFKQVVKQHPEDLGQIIKQGQVKTRAAKRVKWGARGTTVLTSIGSYFFPALIPAAVASGAVSVGARQLEKRGTQRAQVEVMKQAMLKGYSVPGATESHYRPLVLKAVQKELAANQRAYARGKQKLKRRKPALKRLQQRARAAVDRYNKAKQPYTGLRDKVRQSQSQVRLLNQQLETVSQPPPAAE